MKDIRIKRAKLNTKGGLDVVYIDNDGNEIQLKGLYACPQPLLASLTRLTPFFAAVTEQREASAIDWQELESEDNVNRLRNISVTGLSVSADDANQIYTMSGVRHLASGDKLSVSAPGVKMETSYQEWEHAKAFDKAVQWFITQVEKYVRERDTQPEESFID